MAIRKILWIFFLVSSLYAAPAFSEESKQSLASKINELSITQVADCDSQPMSVGCALYPPLFLGGELSINGCEVTATYIGSREGVFGVVRETKFDLNQTELADTFGGKSFYSAWDAQKKSGGGVIQFKFLAPYKPVSTNIHAEKIWKRKSLGSISIYF